MKGKARKFRGYSPVRAVGGEGKHTKVGVEKGHGPRHAANAREGEDLTAVNTDTVPAMLTPREAVLNRNAAEMAGRGNIEKLNEKGNALAKRGVDLAAKGDSDVDPRMLGKLLSALPDDPRERDWGGAPEPTYERGRGLGEPQPEISRLEELAQRERFERYIREKYGLEGLGGLRGLGPPYDQGPSYAEGTSDMNSKPKHMQRGGPVGPVSGGIPEQQRPVATPFGMPSPAARPMMPEYGRLPVPPVATAEVPFRGSGRPVPDGGPQYGGRPMPAPLGAPQPVQRGGFYPPGMGLFAEGTPEVGGIGDPNQSKAYDPAAVEFKAPDLTGFMKALQEEGKKQGLSAGQMAQIAQQFGGMGGGGGGYANQSPSAGEDFGNPNYIGLGTPSYQGGINEVGYPPGIAPGADFSYEEGGWTGPLDPRWSSPGYRLGNASI